LKQGKTIALISDAGTPLLADPGHSLIKKLIAHSMAFSILPGPSSILSALLFSGFSSDRFQFVGFLPKKKEQKRTVLHKMLHFQGTSIAFETPHRMLDTLHILHKLHPSAQIAIAREISKIHEQCIRGTPEQLIEHSSCIKGECVLLIEYTLIEHNTCLIDIMRILQEEQGLPFKEALKIASRLLQKPKKELYTDMLQQPR
jgi:16S rRNA (cytidine1402-2'-O)-methyltransferase